MIEPTELINGKPIRWQGVCGVIATANVTGRTPQEVFDLFKNRAALAAANAGAAASTTGHCSRC